MLSKSKTVLAAMALAASTLNHTNAQVTEARDLMIIGLDQKVEFAKGGIQKIAPGKDGMLVFDLKDPANPRKMANVPLINSVFGPPTNLALTPDQSLAVITNAVNWVKDDQGDWQSEPDTRLHLLDMTVTPPKLVHTAHSDKQPSGIAISADGKTLAVANRNANTVTFFSIDTPGKKLTALQSVPVEGQASAVAFDHTGGRVLVSKFSEHAVGIIEQTPGGWAYHPDQELTVGRWPYNVQASRTSGIALSANNGLNGFPDGHTDTVSVIDLDASPPRVIDHIVVGDGPEGLTISPNGKLALVPILQGSAALFEDKWFHNKHGKVVVLKIDGKKVTKIQELPVGGFPEGVGFNQDGTYAYVGNLTTDSMTVLKIDGDNVSVVQTIDLPGHPASLRTVHP